MNRLIDKQTKQILINEKLHRELKTWASSDGKSIREITENALCEFLGLNLEDYQVTHRRKNV